MYLPIVTGSSNVMLKLSDRIICHAKPQAKQLYSSVVIIMTTNTHPQHENRLTQESSPYLLQHAHNPVDWWPWSAQALETARRENKLILLSIGYSACHWCHVMAHESFEDEDTARLMNELFINIKVDREERPDLDKIYQTAHQLLNQRPGGWPLTMILTPADQIPFFAGTYFPVIEKHGMPAFKDILARVDGFYRAHPEQIEEQNSSMLNALNSMTQQQSDASAINVAMLDQARHQLGQQFDTQHAGFGKAPKFPHPSNLERLLRHWQQSKANGNEDTDALHMLRMTLHAMASGGLFDQLGGGFFRYSVDDYWMIPHFEKMLYDNGPLLSLYAQAYALTNDPVFARICHETAQWVMREMQAPEGGYYSTLDADSEGEEGKFYVWQRDEVKGLLTDEEYQLFVAVFGLDRQPNFEGHYHLHVFEDLNDEAVTLLNAARQKLFKHRSKRIAPGRDDKILTAWNALMIKGMAQAGRILHDQTYIDSALATSRFIQQHMFADGGLLASYKDGQARYHAYLDDYAFLLDALLELLQAHWDSKLLQFALDIADALLAHFEDDEHGGFYFTAHDHEALIQRPKSVMDEAIPAGNAVAAYALARLGHLLGETRYLQASERTLGYAMPQVKHAPYAAATMLHALEEHLYPPQVIVVRGKAQAMQEWQQALRPHAQPRQMIFYIPDEITDLPGLLNEKRSDEAQTLAYVCSGVQCLAPVTSVSGLIELLNDI